MNMAKVSKQDREISLSNLREALPMHNDARPRPVYAIVKSVAASGMSRRIEFYVPVNDPHDGLRLHSLTWSISAVLGWHANMKGVKVDGCGMDMGFHTLDCVFAAVAGVRSIDWQKCYEVRYL
jgi:hypothetical protein